MDRLSIILTLMTGAVLTGGLVTVALSLGMMNWWAIGASVVVGYALSWPSAYMISRAIKKRDPAWPHRKVKDVDGFVPKKDAPEV